MKKIFQLFLWTALVTLLSYSGSAAEQPAQVPQTTPSANLRVIELRPGTAKNLPTLFSVAAKTHLFLTIADDLHLTADQKTALEKLQKDLQAHVEEVKSNYDKQNEALHTILSSDHIELDNMRENLRNAEALKAELQYFLFESLVKAINVLTPDQQGIIVSRIQMDDAK
jgi:Spy/CpxP family protein refolding chaperone